jgi:hypothetical protein
VKKLISIGVALALLTMAVVPAAVAAQLPTDPGTYSKTPFGILGSGVQLVGTIVGDLSAVLDSFLPAGLTSSALSSIIGNVGGWTGEELAWLTDMTGWSMVAVGDVVSVIKPLADTMGFGDYMEPVADIFYVLGARIFDDWGTLTPGAGTTLPDAGLSLPVMSPMP